MNLYAFHYLRNLSRKLDYIESNYYWTKYPKLIGTYFYSDSKSKDNLSSKNQESPWIQI